MKKKYKYEKSNYIKKLESLARKADRTLERAREGKTKLQREYYKTKKIIAKPLRESYEIIEPEVQRTKSFFQKASYGFKAEPQPTPQTQNFAGEGSSLDLAIDNSIKSLVLSGQPLTEARIRQLQEYSGYSRNQIVGIYNAKVRGLQYSQLSQSPATTHQQLKKIEKIAHSTVKVTPTRGLRVKKPIYTQPSRLPRLFGGQY